MSTIDQILAEFHATGAERLLLVSGKAPVLTTDGEPRGMRGGEDMERGQIEGMILAMGHEIELGQDAFDYTSPTGAVRVTTRVTPKVVQVIIVRATGAAGVSEPAVSSASEDTEAFGVSEPQENVADYNAWEDPDSISFESADPAISTDFEVPESDVDLPFLGTPPGLDATPAPEPESSFGQSPVAAEEPMQMASVDLPELPALPELNEPSALPEMPEAPVAFDPLDQVSDDAAPALETRPDAPAMERLFVKMVGKGCSDLHVSAGSVPLFRKDGHIVDLGGEPELTAGQAEALLNGITPEKHRRHFDERNDVDFAYEIPGVARFRCNLFRDRKGMGGVFRQIPTDIMTADQIGLQPQLLDMCQLKKGLVLVTGPTGSGKSTTLAALIDHINQTRSDHIITIEDPIEFVHPNKKCLINQREVGEHTESFKVALRAALREDPDIVLVGELRDLETVEIALETAETGHLVFGTLHTNTAAGTVSRLIDQFPSGQQARIRTMLAETLQGVIAQTLCRKVKGGRIAALEILVITNAVANLIREDKTHQIISAMQTGGAQGMKTLNDALLELVQRRIVEPEEAYFNAVDKPEFSGLLERNGVEVDGIAALQAG